MWRRMPVRDVNEGAVLYDSTTNVERPIRQDVQVPISRLLALATRAVVSMETSHVVEGAVPLTLNALESRVTRWSSKCRSNQTSRTRIRLHIALFFCRNGGKQE